MLLSDIVCYIRRAWWLAQKLRALVERVTAMIIVCRCRTKRDYLCSRIRLQLHK